MGCLFPKPRFFFLHPQYLRQGKSLKCFVFGDFYKSFSEVFHYLCALSCSTGIIPKYGRPHCIIILIQGHKTMHLPGYGNTLKLTLTVRDRFKKFTKYCLTGLYPLFTILLTVALLRMKQRVVCACKGHYFTAIIHQKSF